MLILAGITINAITGSESAMEKAQGARTKNDEGAMKDAASLKATNLIQEYMDKKYVSNQSLGTGIVTAGDYVANNIVGTEGGYTYAISGGTLIISDTKGNVVYGEILANGNINWNVETPVESIYARLYTDGTLILSHDNDYSNDNEYITTGSTIDEDYQNISNWNKYMPPWSSNEEGWEDYDKTKKITNVIVKNSIWPKSTQNWFYDCSNINQIGSTKANLSGTTNEGINNIKMINNQNMYSMFCQCGISGSLDLSGWDFGNTKVTYLFDSGCPNLTSLTICPNYYVTNYHQEFDYMTKLDYVDLSGTTFEGSGNINGSTIYNATGNSKNAILKNCTIKNIDDYEEMWKYASVENIDLTGTKFENVTQLRCFFAFNSNLKSVNLTNVEFENITDTEMMFKDCENLETIYVSEDFVTNIQNNVNSSDYMFDGCTKLKGGANTQFDSNHIDKEYARIDGGTSSPGYFTKK